jgi:hypothetical protein
VSRATQVNYETDKRPPDANYLAALHAAGHDITYLVTGELQTGALADDEADLVDHFRRIDSERQRVVLATVRLMTPQSSQSGKISPLSEALHQPARDFRSEDSTPG